MASISVAQVATQARQSSSNAELSDYIVAIVQHEPITYSQLRAQILSLKNEYKNAQVIPPEEYFKQTALEHLITRSALAQRAQEYGMRADPQVVMHAITTMANDNNMTADELKKRLEEAGVPFTTLIHSIEQQVVIGMLRERTLDPTIIVNNAEIDEYLAKSAQVSDPNDLQISLAQILIAVPERASDKEVKELEAKAQEAYKKAQQLKKLEDFIALVDEYSDDPYKAQSGGALGVMPMSQYPELFIQAVQGLNSGEVAEPIRSGAGFHIILVLNREQSEMVVTQTHVRHILLNVDDKRTEQQAIDLLLQGKRNIEAGAVDFKTLAQEQSQDASAKDGGELGWAVSGMFVPEFEGVMNRLKPGEISQPVVTRFGVHLIQVLDRRESELTVAQQRDIAREAIHQRKIQEGLEQWAQEIQSEAYIEYREAPQR